MNSPARDDRLSRRGLLAGLTSAGALGLAGCNGGGSDGAGRPADSSGGSGDVVAEAPIPDAPGEYRYAVMGTGTADVTATYFGNWKCPYCAQFSVGKLGTLVTEYVTPGALDIEYRGIARFNGEPFLGEDAAAASRAGLAVWHEEPTSYWAYHEYVMANQPSESQAWATPDRLAEMAEAAGVEAVDAVRSAAASTTYEDAVTATGQAAIQAGVSSTPALAVGGQVVNPLQGSNAVDAVEAALQ